MSALETVAGRMAEATSGFLQPPYLQEGFAAVPDSALAALLAERLASRPQVDPDVHGLRPLFTALIEQHGILTVVDELVGAGGMNHVIDAYVHIVGWGDLVAAVAAARPTEPDRPATQILEPF